jgi:hypothetical protein
MRSVGGMDGAQATSAMWGRMQWKRWRILELVLVEMSNNVPMVWWMGKLGRSLWETMESIPVGGGHSNDKVWGSPCTWA